MTTIPVLWVSWHDHIIPRGYADQGFLEVMFAREVWTPPDALTFEHHEIRDNFGERFQSGAVVILPARHHASEEDAQRFLNELDELAWSLVILSGDEEWVFPWDLIPEIDTRKVWIMQPRPEHSHLSGLIPGGWYPNTHEYILDAEPPFTSRPLDWFFAGQVTHIRREECASVLRRLSGGKLLETKGYLQGMEKHDYFDNLVAAKVVPCPSGPMTVDTARPLEAMEAGCVPVVDMVTARGEEYDYWSLVFGEDCPLPRQFSWRQFPNTLRHQLSIWPLGSNIIFSWWQQWKRRITIQLDNDIKEVMSHNGGLPEPIITPVGLMPDDAITVIVTTSPTPIHPSTEHIREVIDSIREQLPSAEIIIAIDGVHPDDADLTDDYNTYIQRVLYLCNFYWANVVPVFSQTHEHQANMTRAALDLVNTPLVLFVEHDTPITGDIDWLNLNEVILKNHGNLIQFYFNDPFHPEHEHLLIGGKVFVNDVPLYQTTAWWQRPHLASADFYRDILDRYFPPTCRTMIEDKLYGIFRSDYIDNGPSAWDRWKLFVYAPEDTMIRSRHLDSRGNHPKTEMRFE